MLVKRKTCLKVQRLQIKIHAKTNGLLRYAVMGKKKRFVIFYYSQETYKKTGVQIKHKNLYCDCRHHRTRSSSIKKKKKLVTPYNYLIVISP